VILDESVEKRVLFCSFVYGILFVFGSLYIFHLQDLSLITDNNSCRVYF
jgi:hypothetical protein